MLEFLLGLLIGIYLGQTYNVPNLQHMCFSLLQSLDKYKKS